MVWEGPSRVSGARIEKRNKDGKVNHQFLIENFHSPASGQQYSHRRYLYRWSASRPEEILKEVIYAGMMKGLKKVGKQNQELNGRGA
jgi:hypothetical protein